MTDNITVGAVWKHWWVVCVRPRFGQTHGDNEANVLIPISVTANHQALAESTAMEICGKQQALQGAKIMQVWKVNQQTCTDAELMFPKSVMLLCPGAKEA